MSGQAPKDRAGMCDYWERIMSGPPVTPITGDSSGIDVATARRLLARGHRVAVTGRGEDRLRVVAEGTGKFEGLSTLVGVLGPALPIRATLPALRETRVHVVLIGSVVGSAMRRGTSLRRDQVGGHRTGREHPVQRGGRGAGRDPGCARPWGDPSGTGSAASPTACL
jgi:hypothetical protein